MKQQKLSAQKYIETRARSLPIYKCLVNKGWQQTMMASVIIMRKHVNGNVTAGLFLVDLYCLGIKDTFFFFNGDEGFVMDKLGAHSFIELDYNLAHNIIYAGHDFAAEFDIQPHKLFSTTQFMLEEDNENIPLIEIHTGDENGNPQLWVDESYNYAPILEKLKKHAGEGNYHFFIGTNFNADNSRKDENEFRNKDNDEEEPENDDSSLADIEYDFLDFPDVREVDEEELEEAMDDPSRSLGDEAIIHAELMMRFSYEQKPGYRKEYDEIVGLKEFSEWENKFELHEKEFNNSASTIEAVTNEFKFLPDAKETDLLILTETYFSLFQKYADNEVGGFMILNSMPLINLTLNLEKLKGHLNDYPALTQLLIIAFSLSLQSKLDKPDEKFLFVINASSPVEAFPSRKIHYMQYKIFWVIQSLAAMWNKDEAKMAHYHSLLTVVGIGGKLRHAYALYLGEWLANKV